ncbi:hypothetical protein FB45DRAFT_879070 [Roridomyces roridus]|uniref:Uncharacterized protein n=1 Tax=Roridomyces roridus TaxID=1738132 RepID=A0AAD7B060_9AGAR|nr:hypothetical protein FB45DRAFT_879070 [Roridomyces roridus]
MPWLAKPKGSAIIPKADQVVGSESDRFCLPEKTFEGCHNHPLLERIAFRTFSIDEDEEKSLIQFRLSTFDRTPFPALKEIEHPGFIWDIAESQIEKDPFVKWAEKFQKEGIELVDRPEACYRPRRKFVPERSSGRRGD